MFMGYVSFREGTAMMMMMMMLMMMMTARRGKVNEQTQTIYQYTICNRHIIAVTYKLGPFFTVTLLLMQRQSS